MGELMIMDDSAVKMTTSQPTYNRWPDIAFILILALLPCLFFWRLVTPNPADQMRLKSGDFTEQYFPLRAFAAQEWVQGQLSLWNPYLYGGQPALADIQSGALYPPHVLEALILGWGGPLLGREIGFPLWALEWQVIAHFSLAGVGTYLFVRRLGRQAGVSLRRARFGGVMAALVFTYGGYLTGFPVQQMTIVEVSAWLPWVLWGFSQVEGTRSGEKQRRGIAWGGLAFGLAILAGHPQTVLYIFYLTLAYAIFRAVCVWRAEDRTPLDASKPSFYSFNLRYLRVAASQILALPFFVWLAMILLGLTLSAAQLLPTLEFIRHSLRADMSYPAVSAGLPLNELISILYPGFFGGSPEYVGIVTLVLIGLALALARPRREVFFWTGAGLVSLILAFGGHTFLYPLFYLLAPGFEMVRQQERAFLIYSFSAAVLAGYGAMAVTGPLSKLTRLRYGLFEHRLRLAAVVAAVLVGFFIYGSAAATARGDKVNLFYGVLWHHLFGLIILGGVLLWLTLRQRRWLRRWWGMSLLALWLALNLFTVNWRFNLEKREVEPFTPNGVTQFLQANLKSPARVVSGGYLSGGNSAAAVYHLEDLTGNTPLQLAGVNALLQQMPSWRLWQLMNARYVVDKRDISGPGLTQVMAEGELRVFEIGDPFPRAWLVGQTETIADDSQAIARLAEGSFELRRSAIVAEPLESPLADPVGSTAKVVEMSPAYLKVDVKASGPHLLVLSQVYYPGWQAAIDGQPAAVRRVNAVQQGVVVPAGRHTVTVSFSPASFWWGGIISVVGWLGWLALVVKLRLRRTP